MISAAELLARIKRATRCIAGYTGDVDSETYLKVQERLRGGWLFDLVAGQAAALDGLAPEALVIDEDFVRDVQLRIEGIAKIFGHNPDRLKKIIDRSHQELDDRLENGYLGTVARNTQTDQNRNNTRQLKRYKDPEELDKIADERVEVPDGAPPPQWDAPQLDESQDIRDERTRLLFGSNAKRPVYELLLFAWCPPRHRLDRNHPGRLPQAAVDDLGTLTLHQLADSWIEMFSEIEKRDPAEVRCLFAGMLPERGHQQLSEFWDPLRAVDDWTGKVRKEGANGNPFHKRVVFLYGDILRYSAARIVAQLGPRRLDQLAADFVLKFEKLRSQTSNTIDDFKAYLKQSKQADKPLAYSFKPGDTVGRWLDSVSDQRTLVESKQLSEGLRPVLEAEFTVWEKLAFLHCHCFGYKPALVADHYRRKPLRTMRTDLVYAFEELWDLEEKLVVEAMWGLRRALIGRSVPANLGACAAQGRDLAQEVQLWSDKVRQAVEPSFVDNDGARLFALRHHLPTAKGACA